MNLNTAFVLIGLSIAVLAFALVDRGSRSGAEATPAAVDAPVTLVGVDAPVVWMEAKTTPIGSLKAAVTNRPAPDRVVLQANWARGTVSGACLLELVLPDGVLVVNGDARRELSPEAESGGQVWWLEVPQDGRELDALVRYCVETEDGIRATECAVRISTP